MPLIAPSLLLRLACMAQMLISNECVDMTENEKKKTSPRLRRFLNVMLVSTAASAVIGGVIALTKVMRHAYFARHLRNVAFSLLRDEIGLWTIRGIFAGLTLLIFCCLAGRIVKSKKRRLRAYAIMPLFFVGILALVSFIVTLIMRDNLAGPLAEHLPVRVVVLRAIVPSISGPVSVPKSFLSLASLILLTISFLLAAGIERFIFRKQMTEESELKEKPVSRIPALSAFGVLLALLVAYRVIAPQPHDVNAPDIIFISIDTVRADHLSCYGYHRQTTPNLDMLADEGILVEQHISHSAWTLPTHMSMFTGLLPYQHGVTNIGRALPPRKLVITEYLKEKGYRTAAFVTNVLLSPTFGYGSGVDHYFFRADFPAREIVTRAGRWIEKNRTPAFAFIHLYDAHYPYASKQGARGAFGASPDGLEDLMQEPFFEFAKAAMDFSPAQKEAVIARYDEEILDVDMQLGVFFNKLRAIGRYDNAWIIVTADHGEEFDDHGLWGHSITLYEEMLRVPLIIKPPGAYCRGFRLQGQAIEQKALFNLISGASVLSKSERDELQCAGSETPMFLQKLIATGGVLAESEAFAPHRFAIRKDNKKLIEPFAFEMDHFQVKKDWELFDLGSDPFERNNIYKTEDSTDLAGVIQAANSERENTGPGQSRKAGVSDRDKANLKALGYLQ